MATIGIAAIGELLEVCSTSSLKGKKKKKPNYRMFSSLWK